jgi:hypothetical protein
MDVWYIGDIDLLEQFIRYLLFTNLAFTKVHKRHRSITAIHSFESNQAFITITSFWLFNNLAYTMPVSLHIVILSALLMILTNPTALL